MKAREVVFFLALVGVAFLLTGEPTGAQTPAPVQVLINTWALGVNEAVGCPGDINGGWQHNAEISLSRCYKNPAPPDGQQQGGAAFKCGPVNGQCAPGTIGQSWQDFNAQDRGVPLAGAYEVSFTSYIVCVGCDYLRADLLGSNDGQNWSYLDTVLDFLPGSDPCGPGIWSKYCGSAVMVPHYDQYRLLIESSYSQQLGVKWTGLELWFTPQELATPTETAVPTNTATPEPTITTTPTADPTQTPTPAATEAYLPLVLTPGAWLLQCPGNLTTAGPYVVCEAGD